MIDHDRARELHATSLRALMEAPPPNRYASNWADMADWIDAVVTAHREAQS